MQFNAKELSTALRLIKPAVAKRSTLSILEGVKLAYTTEPGCGYVTLSATNLDISMSTTIQDSSPYIDYESVQVVNYKQLKDSINPKGGDVTLDTGMIRQDGREGLIQTYDPLDFPTIPEYTSSPGATLSSEDWGMLRLRVLPFVSPKNTRPAVECVLTEITPGLVTFTAADGFRLSTMTLPAATQSTGVSLIHAPVLNAVPKQAELVSLSLPDDEHQGFIFFSVKGQRVSLYYRSVDADYPDYRQIIPRNTPSTVKVRADVVATAGKMKSVNDNRLTIREGSVTLDQTTWNHDSATVSGVDKVGFNNEYLATLLPVAADGYLTLQGSHDEGVWMAKDETTTMLIMPMVVRDR